MENKILKKRGRKKKVVNLLENTAASTVENISTASLEPSNDNSFVVSVQVSNHPTSQLNEDHSEKPSILANIENKNKDETTLVKKRGRKPKGGKLVVKNIESSNTTDSLPNIILHLKCSISDLADYNMKLDRLVTNELRYNPEVPPEIETYNSKDSANFFSTYQMVEPNDKKNENIPNTNNNYAYYDMKAPPQNAVSNNNNICKVCNKNTDEVVNEDNDDSVNMKEINQKLKKMKINLYKNTLQDKKSACFWCTYDYDNQSCYIPKYEMDDKIYGYGSFCRPECAVAYLMKESLDDSTKFERYHLLNHIYCKVYDYKKNIKPAPNPYYLLDKFYGNLSIQEYRKLLKTEHLLTIIEKPLSRVLPELYEDNDNFILGIYGNSSKTATQSSNVYKVKRQSEKQSEPSKNVIIKEKFGLSVS